MFFLPTSPLANLLSCKIKNWKDFLTAAEVVSKALVVS